MRISARLEGEGEVASGLRRAQANLLRDVDRAMARTVSVSQLKGYVPVDSGALRNSIRSRRRGLGSWRTSIGNRRAFYAHLVDLRGGRRTRRQWNALILRRLRRRLLGVRVRQ